MSSPVVPAQFKALIPDPGSSLCANFIGSLIKLPTLLYTWFAWAFDSSGNPSKAFVNQSQRTGSYMFSACLQTENGSILLCDGREVSQTTYPDLYAAIAATYGSASAGNFKLPDFRAKFPCGIGTFTNQGAIALGTPRGVDQVVLTTGNLPPHNHSDGPHNYLLKAPYVGSVTGGDTVNSGTEQAVGGGDGGAIVSVGSSTPIPMLPPLLGVYVYIIC